MAKLTWDQTGEHFYETGVDRGVLFPFDSSTGKYGKGVAWNGLTAVNESPSGAESNKLYADNDVYLNLISAEEFSATIEAYTYPDEFAECDGSASISEGITIGQQPRKLFAFAYRTRIGNDTQGDRLGHKIHIVYNCTAAPSSRDYATVNESPEAATLSWEVSTTKIDAGANHRPTATVVIDSTKVSPEVYARIEQALYGTESEDSKIILPTEFEALIGG